MSIRSRNGMDARSRRIRASGCEVFTALPLECWGRLLGSSWVDCVLSAVFYGLAFVLAVRRWHFGRSPALCLWSISTVRG